MGNSNSSNCIECDCEELAKRSKENLLNPNGLASSVKNYVDDAIKKLPDTSTLDQLDDDKRQQAEKNMQIYIDWLNARDNANNANAQDNANNGIEPFIGGTTLKEGLDDDNSLNCGEIDDDDCPRLDCKDEIESVKNDINQFFGGSVTGYFLNNIKDRINNRAIENGQNPLFNEPQLDSINANSELLKYLTIKSFLEGETKKDVLNVFNMNNTTEGMQNYLDPNSGFINSAFSARYNYFKDKPNFLEDCKANTNNSIDEFIINIEQDIDSKISSYNTLLNNYKSLDKLRISITELTSDKNRQITNIEKDINYYKKGLNVDNTKASYKNDNLNFNQSIRYFLLILYYFAFVVYLIFSNFIKDKLYENKKIAFLLFLYLISPFIIAYILNGIVSLYIYIIEYFNIKGDILSYNDIVNNSNIA